MITEQRLRFEAWATPLGYNLTKYFDPPHGYTSSTTEEAFEIWQAAFGQGYQSALEDRQGEAVAHILPAELKRLQEARDANLGLSHAYVFANASRNGCGPTVPLFTLPQPAQPGEVKILAEQIHAAAVKLGITPGTFDLTGPQISHLLDCIVGMAEQPDQWNVAIEAAADTAHDAIHNAIYKIDDCAPVKAAVVDAILALRKGA